jgi:hypothetical protein
MREVTAILIAPIMAATGYRFGKEWRCESGTLKHLAYEYLVSTVTANCTADHIAKAPSIFATK